jgi:DDE superfamily endonuclease
VSPRTYPPAPGWSPEGHRIKAPLEYARGTEKVWVYGALRVRDGKALTLTAPSNNTKGYLRLLEAVAQANPSGDLYLITDNLSSHKSSPIREWLENHPRVEQVFIPPWGRVGSTCRRGSGEYVDEKPWQDRALLMLERSSRPGG